VRNSSRNHRDDRRGPARIVTAAVAASRAEHRYTHLLSWGPDVGNRALDGVLGGTIEILRTGRLLLRRVGPCNVASIAARVSTLLASYEQASSGAFAAVPQLPLDPMANKISEARKRCEAHKSRPGASVREPNIWSGRRIRQFVGHWNRGVNLYSRRPKSKVGKPRSLRRTLPKVTSPSRLIQRGCPFAGNTQTGGPKLGIGAFNFEGRVSTKIATLSQGDGYNTSKTRSECSTHQTSLEFLARLGQ